MKMPAVESLVRARMVVDKLDAVELRLAIIANDFYKMNLILETQGLQSLFVEGRKRSNPRSMERNIHTIDYFDAGGLEEKTLLRINRGGWFIGTVKRTRDNLMLNG